MKRTISASDDCGKATYAAAQHWYRQHGLRAASEGGLFPDLFLRRLVDDVEISWAATAPLFAPEGFSFAFEPGVSRLPVEEVAKPLWDLLRWFAANPPQLDEEDQASWDDIVRTIDRLEGLSGDFLAEAYLPEAVRALLDDLRVSQHQDVFLLQSDRITEVPALRSLAPAVAMFGGVSPSIGTRDADALFAYLAKSAGGGDGERLASLVENNGYSPLTIPYQDGYSFAENLLDDLELPNNDWIDVRWIAKLLNISIDEVVLETKTVRGVALAGEGFRPSIVVNTTSIFNASDEGKRFTIAHELCHILHDRSRARRVAHVSGPWVAQGFEKRANAFAAYLLMPRELVVQHIGGRDIEDRASVESVAKALRVNESALVEHLFNLRLIREWQREALRSVFHAS